MVVIAVGMKGSAIRLDLNCTVIAIDMLFADQVITVVSR